ncbi:MAG: hypothetical protein ABFC78_12220 [Methanoregula sp.]
MDRQEHIHIVAAGEGIGAACAAAIRDLRDITRIVVFADTDVYVNTSRDSEQEKAHKDAIREAVGGVKSLAASLGIPTGLVYIAPPAPASVAAAMRIMRSKDEKESRDRQKNWPSRRSRSGRLRQTRTICGSLRCWPIPPGKQSLLPGSFPVLISSPSWRRSTCR